MSSAVFALSIHADYKCRHSGVCCSTNWDVPVEVPIYRSLVDALHSGALRVAPGAETLDPFIVEPDLPDDAGAIFERTDAGQCVFFERDSRLCVVHRDLGEGALAATCRHFPRLAVRDGRGTSITLSHFCPTAASMLFRDDVSLHVVTAPVAFPPGDYDGLDVNADDLPPLLTPTMLMDLDGYGAWERHMIARCAAAPTPEVLLATLTRDARELRGWKPGAMTLAAAVESLPAEFVHAERQEFLAPSFALYTGVLGAVPDDFRPEPDEDGLDRAYEQLVRDEWSGFAVPLNRYVAAKAFACWTAYQGRGVASIVRGLESALALVRIEAARQCRDARRALDADLLLEAFRSADFTLNHLAVGEDLADAWSRAESE
jgi:Fe-S-cluster containining protein